MKVLFFSPTIDDQGPRGIRLCSVSKHFSDSGMQLHVLCYALRNTQRKIKKSEFTILQAPLMFRLGPLSRFTDHAGKFRRLLRRVAEKVLSRKQKLDVYEMLKSYSAKQILKIADDFDCIVISILPFSSYHIVPILKDHKPHLKVILDIGDPLAMNSSIESTKKAYETVEGQALRLADGVVVTNQKTKEAFQDYYSIDTAINVIPQGFDPNIFQPASKPIDGALKMVYAGAIYSELRPIKYLIKAVNETEIPVELEVIGGSNGDNKHNVRYVPRLSQEALHKHYQDADILVFIDNHFGIQTPGKIYELLAMQKPILFLHQQKTETYTTAESFGQVIFVENSDVSIADVLTKMPSLIKKIDSEFPAQHTWYERSKSLARFIDKIVSK